MKYTQIEQAINEKKIIEFFYDGKKRIVEPHLIGITSKDNKALRAYQIEGHSSSKLPGWRMFILMNITDVMPTNEIFSIRQGYNPTDKDMKRILCRVE